MRVEHSHDNKECATAQLYKIKRISCIYNVVFTRLKEFHMGYNKYSNSHIKLMVNIVPFRSKGTLMNNIKMELRNIMLKIFSFI